MLFRSLIRVGLALSVLQALFGLLVALAVLGGAGPGTLPTGPIEYPTEPTWIVALGLVEAVVGIANGVALVLSLTGRAWTALGIARIAVLAGLVAGGLLGTYVGQLGALADILLRVLLLLLVLDARARLREAR